MSNIFDGLAINAFKVIADTMGCRATWSPSLFPDRTETVGVRFKSPTMKERQFLEMDGFHYSPLNRLMEYMLPDFQGLHESVENGGVEVIEIKGVVYEVQKTIKIHDGTKVLAKLIPQ